MRKTTIAAAMLVLAGCGNGERDYDATGTFEATEITVSAEQSGILLSFDVTEGDELAAGQEAGLIDTTQLWLKLQQLEAAKQVYRSQKPEVEKQLAATRQQLAKARQEEQRYEELVSDGAAPAKMLDDARSQRLVLQRQLDAQLSALTTSTRSLEKQEAATDVQMNQLRDQLRRCHVLAPTAGAVLEKYAERGEFVATGKPLMKLADTALMYLRAYVTTGQLEGLKVGQAVKVFADYGGGQRKMYDGKVTWVSSQSEFTPKTILTDDERADLVYAIKVAVRNDGSLKIGMYGEVKF